MPSGPKKRRAAKKKNDAGTTFANPTCQEEKLVAAVELSENLSNVSIMNAGDVNVKTVKEIGSKGSQCVDEISLGTPLILESENVKKSDDALVLELVVTKEKESESFENMGKESESHPLYDEFSMHVPVLDSVITVEKSSETAVSRDEKSESESFGLFHLQLSLIEPSSKDTKGDECAEIGETACHGQLPMVNELVLAVKNSAKMNIEGFLEDPFKEAHILLLKRLHAMCAAIDQSRLKTLASKEAESAHLKVLAKQLMTLVEEETRLKASYDDWYLRFGQVVLQISQYHASDAMD
ncbi:hypothetical protein L2E82_10647 [Cichorium intybus]|uniref:Uncharacterized protein n=1 Tax=Cichorium intybus TaxID=13427 RepID=A0ACB9GC59_CICIN|nr:hypothetical protein L2E82_10647 [Cichorium intybus]